MGPSSSTPGPTRRSGTAAWPPWPTAPPWSAMPMMTPRPWSLLLLASQGPPAGLHGRIDSMSGNLPRPASLPRPGPGCMMVHRSMSTTPMASVCSASGTTSRSARMAAGATGSCCYRGHELITTSCSPGGFSKAYSSLVAFIACPTRAQAPAQAPLCPRTWSSPGPSPVASLASALVGLQVNVGGGDDAGGDRLWALTQRVLDHLDKLGAYTLNHSGFLIVEVPWPTPMTWPGPVASCSTGASTYPRLLPGVPRGRSGSASR